MQPLHGLLDMLVLRTLILGPLHGYGVAKAIRILVHRGAGHRVRVALPGAEAAGAEGLDRLELGDVRAEPPREVSTG